MKNKTKAKPLRQQIIEHPAVDEIDTSPGYGCRHMVYLKEGWNNEGTSTICEETLTRVWYLLKNVVTEGPTE